MDDKEILIKRRNEIVDFFESDEQFIINNIDILDSIIHGIYNLKK